MEKKFTLKFGDIVITKEATEKMVDKITRLQLCIACDNFLSRHEKQTCRVIRDVNACSSCSFSFIRTLCGY